jgi:hypothetical protein
VCLPDDYLKRNEINAMDARRAYFSFGPGFKRVCENAEHITPKALAN